MKKILGGLLIVVVILLFFWLMNVANGFLEAITVWGISIFMSALLFFGIELLTDYKIFNKEN